MSWSSHHISHHFPGKKQHPSTLYKRLGKKSEKATKNIALAVRTSLCLGSSHRRGGRRERGGGRKKSLGRRRRSDDKGGKKRTRKEGEENNVGERDKPVGKRKKPGRRGGGGGYRHQSCRYDVNGNHATFPLLPTRDIQLVEEEEEEPAFFVLSR